MTYGRNENGGYSPCPSSASTLTAILPSLTEPASELKVQQEATRVSSTYFPLHNRLRKDSDSSGEAENNNSHSSLKGSCCRSVTIGMGAHDIPAEPGKMAAVVLFLVVAAFSNWMVLAYIHDFVGNKPLPDLLFDIIPHQKWAQQTGDAMVTLCCVMLIMLFLLHSNRVVVMRRTFFILGVLYSMRSVSMFCTQLPSAYVHNGLKCAPQLNASERTFAIYFDRVAVQTLHLGMQDTNKKMLCGDLLFSGHSLMLVMCALTISHYLPESLRQLRYVPIALAIVGVLCMVISRVMTNNPDQYRTHYTIDVLFAYILSVGVFTLYHAFCEIETHNERKNSILWRQLWLFRVVNWLEKNVEQGRIVNKLQIPYARSFKLKDYSGSTTPANVTSATNSSMLSFRSKIQNGPATLALEPNFGGCVV